MAGRAALSKAELEIAQVLWRLGVGRVREVVEALSAERKMDFATVQTYLRRLKLKGYLKTRREGRADVYLPAVKPGSVIKEVVGEFVDRAFEGRVVPLMQHLIDDRGLSEKEIEELQAMLNRLKKRGES